jgi:multimeric flavodoxin WrbA
MMGAHRKTGYTKKALDYLLSQIPEGYDVKVDYAIDKKVTYCKSCYYCKTHKGECVIKDDMTQIYQNFIDSDILIFITSIYFSGAPSALKTILDRCQMFYCHGKMDLPEKPTYVLAIGGAPSYPTQFTGLMENLKHLLIYVNAKIKDTLFFSHSDKFGGTFEGENKERLETFVAKIFEK